MIKSFKSSATLLNKPFDCKISSSVSKEDLSRAVRRVSILSNTLTHQVKFSLKSNNLTLSTTNADVGGEGKEVLECEFDGELLELGYNANYITDILNKIDSEEVIFELSSSVAAGLIYSPNSSKDDFLCLVMPLRLAD